MTAVSEKAGMAQGSADDDLPRVSVITVVFNGAATLERTIQNVLSQTWPSVEYVVVDGGSTDGTVDILRRHDDRIAHWVSEPDRGLYDAMNKGLDAATGDWVVFMGADDCFADAGSVAEYMEALRRYEQAHPGAPKPALLYGDVTYTNGLYFRSSLGPKMLLGNRVHHQAALYARSLFDGFRYDVNCRHVSDYELNLMLYLRRAPALYLGKSLALCDHGGVSSDAGNVWKNVAELNLLRRRHVSLPANLALSAALKLKTHLWLARNRQ